MSTSRRHRTPDAAAAPRLLVVGGRDAARAAAARVGRPVDRLSPDALRSGAGSAGPDDPADSDDPADPVDGAMPSVAVAESARRRLAAVLDARAVETVLVATSPDEGPFYGALRACRGAGVRALVPRRHADAVLTVEDLGARALGAESGAESATGAAPGRERSEPTDRDPVAVALDPWSSQSAFAKRAFDAAFALFALAALAPLLVLVAVAVKLDSPGPALYAQRRTGRLGEPIVVPKFRSMVTDAEAESGARLSDEDAGDVDPRVTRVGRALRRTHLDELPQLWSILRGEMSVVGPRPERPELEADILAEVPAWRKRWFVAPGLTGLAQVREATGFEPARKLRADLEYVRRRSLALDVRIVCRELRDVAGDAWALARGGEEAA